MTVHRATAVASRAILLSIQEGTFRVSDIRRGLDEPPSPSTVNRVLRQLEADGWLTRTRKESDIWRAGMKARTHGDMGSGARDRANRDASISGEPADDSGGFDFSW